MEGRGMRNAHARVECGPETRGKRSDRSARPGRDPCCEKREPKTRATWRPSTREGEGVDGGRRGRKGADAHRAGGFRSSRVPAARTGIDEHPVPHPADGALVAESVAAIVRSGVRGFEGVVGPFPRSATRTGCGPPCWPCAAVRRRYVYYSRRTGRGGSAIDAERRAREGGRGGGGGKKM
jgi:hypothetical protein